FSLNRVDQGFLLIGQRPARCECDVAAEQRARLLANRSRHVVGERIDCHECRDAKRYRRHIEEKTAPRASAFPPCESCDLPERSAHALVSVADTTFPTHKRIVLAARSARTASWVTRTIVEPDSRLSDSRRSSTSLPVFASRFPVGSSAKRILGEFAKARAMAT